MPEEMEEPPENLNALSFQIISGAMEVHDELGSGLLESGYQAALAWELVDRGHDVEREVSVPARYKGHDLDVDYRVDLLVDGQIIVETKAVQDVHPVHEAQLLSYLQAMDMPLGLLINFHAPRIMDDLRRFVN